MLEGDQGQKTGTVFKEAEQLPRDELIRKLVQVVVGEVLGTAMLMFWGCSCCVLINDDNQGIISWTFGTVVFMMVHILGPITMCHINPSVTVTFFIFGYISLVVSLLYIGAQVIGALIGYSVLRLVITIESLEYGFQTNDLLCVTLIKEEIGMWYGLAIEVIGTGLLCLLVCAVCDPINVHTNSLQNISVQFCMVITIIIFITGPYTRASLNPARSLAPAIFTGYYTNQWVYWVGPLLGAVLVSFTYHILFLPKKVTLKQ